jgi:hypothetical protein
VTATPETIVGQVARDAINDRAYVSGAIPRQGRRSFLNGYWQVAVSKHPEIAEFKPLFVKLTDGAMSPRDGKC